jgi:hypothetical protein
VALGGLFAGNNFKVVCDQKKFAVVGLGSNEKRGEGARSPCGECEHPDRRHRWCWTSRPDLGERWPSRLVATAAKNRLTFAAHCWPLQGGLIKYPKLPWAHLFANATLLVFAAVAVVWWWLLAWLIWRLIQARASSAATSRAPVHQGGDEGDADPVIRCYPPNFLVVLGLVS